jgi:sulfur carrier protein
MLPRYRPYSPFNTQPSKCYNCICIISSRIQIIMNIQLNGDTQQFDDGLTAAQLVDKLGLQGQRIAMEVNQEIVPRSNYDTYYIQENDKIEIIHAVGGG